MNYQLFKNHFLMGIIITSFLFSACSKNTEHFVSDNKHPWFGVSTDKLTDQLRTFFNIPEDLGVLVTEVVEDSPAEKYGLKAGDVIIQVGKKDVKDTYTLIRALDYYDVGDEVDVKLIRNKEEKTLKVTLGEEKGRFRHQFSYEPELYEVYIPEIDIEIPPIDIDIPEIDMKKLEKFHQKIRENLEFHEDELKEKLENLNEKLKEIKIRTTHRKSIVL
jgi:C-terminal processing protease CtpA/Prc